jgi:hypothetical protein
MKKFYKKLIKTKRIITSYKDPETQLRELEERMGQIKRVEKEDSKKGWTEAKTELTDSDDEKPKKNVHERME